MSSYPNWLGLRQLVGSLLVLFITLFCFDFCPAEEWLNTSLIQLNDEKTTDRRLSKRDAAQDKFPTIYYICGEYPNQVYSIARSILVCSDSSSTISRGSSRKACSILRRNSAICVDFAFDPSPEKKIHWRENMEAKRLEQVQQEFHGPFSKEDMFYLANFEQLEPSVVALSSCQVCKNGGRDLMVACTSAIQCTPYFRGISTCIDGRCCTSGASTNNPDPNLPDAGLNTIYNPYGDNTVIVPNPNNNQYDNTNNGLSNNLLESRHFGYCPRGDRSNIRCSAKGQCPMNHICLNGMCCPKGNNDYLQACGGQMAIAACMGGTCLEGMVCTASDYCCQCPVGRSGGRCNQGGCAPGYRCHTNGFCCAWCPDNTTPFGTCKNNQQCAPDFQCRTGDICCGEKASNHPANSHYAAQYVPYGGYLTNGA